MKRLLLIFIAIMGGIIACRAEIYEVATVKLNVRADADPSAKVIGSVKEGDRIDVIDIIDSTWAVFKFNGQKGYVNKKYLRIAPASEAKPQPAPAKAEKAISTKSSKTEKAKKAKEPKATREKAPKAKQGKAKKEKTAKTGKTPKKAAKQSETKAKVKENIQSAKNATKRVTKQAEIKVKNAFKEDADNFTTLINGPAKISNNFDLFYGLSAGVGFSSFIWDGSAVNGRLSASADIFAELDFRKNVFFIPKGYFTQIEVGYDLKGAARYPLHYMHAHVYPFGYKLPVKPVKLTGKVGVALGVPLGSLESYQTAQSWSCYFQIGIIGGIGAEYKHYGISANVEYDFNEVGYTRVTLNNIALLFTFSYKLGKLNHRK